MDQDYHDHTVQHVRSPLDRARETVMDDARQGDDVKGDETNDEPVSTDNGDEKGAGQGRGQVSSEGVVLTGYEAEQESRSSERRAPSDHAAMDLDKDLVPPKKGAKNDSTAQNHGSTSLAAGGIASSNQLPENISGHPTVVEGHGSMEPARKKAKKRAAGTSTKQASKKADRAAHRADSPASVGVMEIEEPDNEADTKLYCICQSVYVDEERMMIACDRCDEWYHTSCMKMREEETELVDVFICPNCESETAQRTTWKPKCMRSGCTHAAIRPLSRYCSERCGVLVAAQRIAKVKAAKTGPSNVRKPQQQDRAWAEKLLGVPRINSAKRREGVVLWSEGQDRMQWLDALLGHELARKITGLVSEAGSQNSGQASAQAMQQGISIALPQLEELSQLQSRLLAIQHSRTSVNAALDLLAARTKFLHLAEDRVATLEPLRGEEADASAASKSKKSKSKTSKGAAKPDDSDPALRGQPRCGYDERLSWDDARFLAWSASASGKAMLNEDEPIDGRLQDGKDDAEGDAPVIEAEQQARDRAVPTICGLSKRKCKRHSDWSVVRGADFEVNREQQTHLLASLALQAQQTETHSATLRQEIKLALADEEHRREHADEQFARSLANQGSRRTTSTTSAS